MVGVIRYRVGQFFRALSPQVPEVELRAAVQTLRPEARALFLRQETQDQRHAFAVYQALRRKCHSDPDLLAAALLHDVGKAAAPCPAWVRAIAVLMGRFSPALLARLTIKEPDAGGGSAPEWRRALSAHVQHAAVGARWAQEADCCGRAVTLIRRHREQLDSATSGEDELLIALQAADSVN